MTKKALGAIALALPLAALAAPEYYTLDPYHTYAHFEVEHLGVSNLRGRFDRSSGKFSIDHAAKSGSVELAIETASVSTGDNNKGTRPVLLRSIISLAHDLGMDVVAEGAETDSDAVELYQLGCEYAQGFVFGEPMTPEAARKLLLSEQLETAR